MKNKKTSGQSIVSVVSAALLVIGLIGNINHAYAACFPDSFFECTTPDGKKGISGCAGGFIIPCTPIPPEPKHVILYPSYIVVDVIYAPPGGSGSMVSYQAGGNTQFTSSLSHSFKEGNTVSATFMGDEVAPGSGATYDWNRTKTDSHSLDVRKSWTSTRTVFGPGGDGINHDYDEIWLWLCPAVDVTVTSVSSADWTLSSAPSLPNPCFPKVPAGVNVVAPFFAGKFTGSIPLDADEIKMFNDAGVSPNDFPEILRHDPLASVSAPDPARYIPLNYTCPYKPAPGTKDKPNQCIHNVMNSTTNTMGSQVTTIKTITASAGPQISLGVLKLQLKDQLTLTWTNSTSESNAIGTTQMATLTIGGPAPGYAGPELFQVYQDVIYGNYTFIPLEFFQLRLSFKGILRASNGTPLASSEVTVANGIGYHTFSDPNGEYRFFGDIKGPIEKFYSGSTRLLPVVRPNKDIDLRLP
jgi:hypothetical protein